MKRIIVSLILILLITVGYLLYLNSLNSIKISYSLNYSNFNKIFNDVLKEFNLDTKNLYIVDSNMDGFMIILNKKDQSIKETMIELLNTNIPNAKSKIINIEYSSKSSMFIKSNRKEPEISNLLQTSRISLKDYLDILSEINIELVLSDYINETTDYYEITTDGLFKSIQLLNTKYNYYYYKNGNLLRVNDIKDIDSDKGYIQIFLGVGEIYDRGDHREFNNNKVVVVLIEK